jgi:predicted HAD superfamily Cof-like phosphohydrolase
MSKVGISFEILRAMTDEIAVRNEDERKLLDTVKERSKREDTTISTALLRVATKTIRTIAEAHALLVDLGIPWSDTNDDPLNHRIKSLADRAVKTRTQSVRQMFVEVLPYQERNDRPTVPSEAAIRLQTRIDAEEFFEKLSALYKDAFGIAYAKDIVDLLAERGEIRKDLHDRLPEFADALADNAVTNEGFAVLFGIDLEPVFQEVHKSNMAKKDGPIDETGKRRKPEGWVGPDVVGILRAQGWQPSSESKPDEPIPYALGPNANEDPNGVCPIHGHMDDECMQCENAQYDGNEAVAITTDDESDLRLMKSTLSLLRNRTKEIANGNDTVSLAALFKTIDEYCDAVVHEHKRQVRLERRALDDINRLLDEAGVSREGQLTADRVRALIDQRNTKVD